MFSCVHSPRRPTAPRPRSCRCTLIPLPSAPPVVAASTDSASGNHAGDATHSRDHDDGGIVHGTVYQLAPATREATIAKLWHREKAGYSCIRVAVHCADGVTRAAYTFAATADNPYFVAGEGLADTASIIYRSVGPSGRNFEYFLMLLRAMRDRGVHDSHLESIYEHILALAEGAGVAVEDLNGDIALPPRLPAQPLQPIRSEVCVTEAVANGPASTGAPAVDPQPSPDTSAVDSAASE